MTLRVLVIVTAMVLAFSCAKKKPAPPCKNKDPMTGSCLDNKKTTGIVDPNAGLGQSQNNALLRQQLADARSENQRLERQLNSMKPEQSGFTETQSQLTQNRGLIEDLSEKITIDFGDGGFAIGGKPEQPNADTSLPPQVMISIHEEESEVLLYFAHTENVSNIVFAHDGDTKFYNKGSFHKGEIDPALSIPIIISYMFNNETYCAKKVIDKNLRNSEIKFSQGECP